jgi:hypothetical protein
MLSAKRDARDANSSVSRRRPIGGYKVMNMIRKGQAEGIRKGDIQGQVRLVADLFKVAA